MKKTEYFVSQPGTLSQLQISVDEVTQKRDAFLLENPGIVTIDREEIHPVDNGNNGVSIILSLTYNPPGA